MKEAGLVVIGAGPAGIAAAVEGAARGISVILIDESHAPGGKVLRRGEGGPKVPLLDEEEYQTGEELFRAFHQVREKIQAYWNATVWGIFDQQTVAFCAEGGEPIPDSPVKAKKLIVASGAYDRAIPFPGWTLPGVFTVGGLNTLVKYHGVLPGNRFLLAGTGPLLLVLASNLIASGADIAGIVEAVSLKDLAASAFPLLAGGRVLKTGFDYLKNIKKHKIPLYRSHIITAARGSEGVEKAVITKVDKTWRPLPGTEKEIVADTIAFGYSLVPSVEITRLCGCKHWFDERLGYWTVEHDEAMETTVPGVFTAGDGVTVKGYAAAIEEGRVAGIAACAQLGVLSQKRAAKAIKSSGKKLERLRKFGASVNALSAPRRGVLDVLTDDTVICRCEEVTMGDIRDAVADGATDVNHLKRKTRIGMGYCQGRFCGQVLNEILWLLTGNPKEREVFTTRVPVRPVPLEALLG